MNTRNKFSVGLLCLGFTLFLLPPTGNRSFVVRPQKLLSSVIDEKSYLSVDQVARFIVSEDSTVRIIDLRPSDEFRSFNIPGSINIPYNEFLTGDPGAYLNNGGIRTIFYSNGDYDSNYALIIARGMNYKDVFVMRGGLNEWFRTIMNTSFTGERISPRENALFENRSRARKQFTEMNSLPDSLKLKFMENKRLTAKKLDGGCE